MEHPFSWVGHFLPNLGDRNYLYTSIFVVLVLLVVSLVYRRKVEQVKEPFLPDSKPSFQNFIELIVEAISGLMENIIGPHYERYIPLLGSIFIYLFCCNIFTIFPGFLPPSDNFFHNLACGLLVFIMYNYYGFRENGFAYLKHFAGPVLAIAPFFFIIELVAHVFRPLTLSIRLFGNMTGDHTLLDIFSNLVPFLVPIIFIILGIIVSLVQALIFSVLGAVYISLAIAHEEH